MKRILVIQDFSVFGNTGGSVSSAIFFAVGVEPVFVPVFIRTVKWNGEEGDKSFDWKCLKSHSDSSRLFQSDLSFMLKSYADYFRENKIHFDGIFINGDFSEGQINNIDFLVDSCLCNDSFLFLGSCCNVNVVKHFCNRANIIICGFDLLKTFSNTQFNDNVKFYKRDFVENVISEVSGFVKGRLIVTDIRVSDKKYGIALGISSIIEKYCAVGKKSCNVKWFYHNNYNSGFCGLDEIFSSVVTGALLNGKPFEKALELGIKTVDKVVVGTLERPAHNWYGADLDFILQLSDS